MFWEVLLSVNVCSTFHKFGREGQETEGQELRRDRQEIA